MYVWSHRGASKKSNQSQDYSLSNLTNKPSTGTPELGAFVRISGPTIGSPRNKELGTFPGKEGTKSPRVKLYTKF